MLIAILQKYASLALTLAIVNQEVLQTLISLSFQMAMRKFCRERIMIGLLMAERTSARSKQT